MISRTALLRRQTATSAGAGTALHACQAAAARGLTQSGAAVITVGPANRGTAAAVGPAGWRECRCQPCQWEQLAESVRPAAPDSPAQTPAQHVLVQAPEGLVQAHPSCRTGGCAQIVTSKPGPEGTRYAGVCYHCLNYQLVFCCRLSQWQEEACKAWG